jgi:glucose-6-phosphate isomerase
MPAEPRPLVELEAQSSALTQCAAWKHLLAHAAQARSLSLRDLLDLPGRYAQFSRVGAGLRLDLSRQRMTPETLQLLLDLAEERALGDWVAHLLSGSPVNNTERRPALHTALRYRGPQPIVVAGEDVVTLVRGERARMLRMADALAGGEYRGHTGKAIRHLVNIGIGGSDLGLVMAVEALRTFRVPGIEQHFVSNIDGTDLARVLAAVNAEETLFIVCSKSFSTIETQLNADAARRWLVEQLSEAAVGRHFVAVSVNDVAMDAFGIARENRFRIWDWVGGRYSLWSSVGLAIAVALGPRHFEALLDGACAMDEHFRQAPWSDNLPVLMGLTGVWNQNFLGIASHAVLPYTQSLHRFPAFLQQLEMESNGKGVTRDGRPVAWRTGTVVWGEPGSNAQHAFFQLLHQGNAAFSVDFIAPARSPAGTDAQHLAGLANMLAQAEAFARGRALAEAVAELRGAGMPEAEVQRLASHKVHPGNHPGSIILFDKLEPFSLGALIALYEHKVFVQSVIWGINPFDQWGVELGKVMARGMSDALRSGKSAQQLPGLAAEISRAQGGL